MGRDPSRYLTDAEPDLAALRREIASDEHGAVCMFLGTARCLSEGRKVLELRYEAYPSMADEVIEQILGEIAARFPGALATARHRVGPCPLGEASVAVVAVSPHRPEAFAACRYVIDEIKARAPIWKQERFEDGSAWVGDPQHPGTGPTIEESV